MSLSRKLLFSSILLLSGSLLMVIGAELALRMISSGGAHFLPLVPNSEAIFDTEYAPGVEGPSVYRVNSMGARARELTGIRSDQYRVLAVGGSTTEGLINDQSRVWTQVLEEELEVIDGREVWVGNVGRSGLNTRHHVVQMPHLIELYDPDVILLLVGVNDLVARLGQDDAYDPDYMDRPGSRERLMRRAFKVHPHGGIVWAEDPWFKRTRLWGILRGLRQSLTSSALTMDAEGDNPRQWAEMRHSSTSRIAELPLLGPALDEYERNLAEIFEISSRHDVELVVMTQPAIWRSDLPDEARRRLWMGGIGSFRQTPGAPYYTAGALATGMDAYNERLVSVSRSHDIRVIDLASDVPKSSRYFYDDCHYTDEANRFIGELIAQRLRSRMADAPPVDGHDGP